MVLSREDKDEASVQNRLHQFALDNPAEWEIVLGFAPVDLKQVLFVQTLLKRAGLSELSEMMAMRAYRLLSDSGGDGA